jgi:hypothetical protein
MQQNPSHQSSPYPQEAAGVYVALGDALGQVKSWHLAAQLALRRLERSRAAWGSGELSL